MPSPITATKVRTTALILIISQWKVLQTCHNTTQANNSSLSLLHPNTIPLCSLKCNTLWQTWTIKRNSRFKLHQTMAWQGLTPSIWKQATRTATYLPYLSLQTDSIGSRTHKTSIYRATYSLQVGLLTSTKPNSMLSHSRKRMQTSTGWTQLGRNPISKEDKVAVLDTVHKGDHWVEDQFSRHSSHSVSSHTIPLVLLLLQPCRTTSCQVDSYQSIITLGSFHREVHNRDQLTPWTMFHSNRIRSQTRRAK